MKKPKNEQENNEETTKSSTTKLIKEIARAEGIISAIGDGVSILDRTFKILYQNQAEKDMMGVHVGEFCYKAYAKKQGICGRCPVALTFKDGRIHTVQRELQTEKEIRYAEITASPLKDSKGNIIAGIEVVRDITERKSIEKELKRLATTDKLTGALNRTKFQETIEKEIERFKRYNQTLSIMLFDIDDFKEVNDRNGHIVGDYVLKTIAGIVRENIRKIDYFVRWGGEEFVVLSSGTQISKAHALAERIRNVIENYEFENVGKVTVSFGVTEFKERDTEDSFIKRADDAMYEAKKKGKNRVEVNV